MSAIDWPVQARTKVVLRSGGVIFSGYGDPITEAEYDNNVMATGEVMQSSGGWRITISLPGGGKAIVPKESVDYVEIQLKTKDES